MPFYVNIAQKCKARREQANLQPKHIFKEYNEEYKDFQRTGLQDALRRF